MQHDTIAVYAFQQKVLNFIKKSMPFIENLIYFSDGCGAQYRNFKNFENLKYHFRDFHLKADWHFFATSHGKNSCDGIGGTIKMLVANASLQRPIKEQILTPKQLFLYADSEI